MSQGLNRVMLIGNLGADPELRYAGNGEAVLNMRLAVTERWKDKNGDKQERTEWCTVVMWGKRAEALSKHLGKGQSIYVEGSLSTRAWEDKEGNKRTTTEIRARDLLFLGGARGDVQRQERSEPSRGYQGGADGANPPDDFGDDDAGIPF